MSHADKIFVLIAQALAARALPPPKPVDATTTAVDTTAVVVAATKVLVEESGLDALALLQQGFTEEEQETIKSYLTAP